MLRTRRLTLIPFGPTLLQAAIRGNGDLAALLDLTVPVDWPGQDLEEILPLIEAAVEAVPARAAWNTIIAHNAERTLIGSAGFKDLPDGAGSVEIGYGVIPAFRGRGYATEAARALIAWAFAQPAVAVVTAECLRDNLLSARVLQRLGMRHVGRDGELLLWELRKDEFIDGDRHGSIQ